MKAPLPFLLAAAAVFAGAAFFYMKRAAEHSANGTLTSRSPTQTALPDLKSTGRPVPAPANVFPPPPNRPAPAKGALMDRVEQKLLTTTKPEVLADMTSWMDDLALASMKRVAGLSDDECAKVKAHLAATRLDSQRNSLRTDLTPAERIAAQAELTRSSEAWLKELLGEERSGKYEASKKARQLADAESAASQGLSRISRAVPLRPEQKDALYAGFVTAGMSASAEAMDPITKFRVISSITDEVPRPSITGEAKAVLTPEQWAQYEEQARLSSEGQNKMMEHLMGMMPVLISSLQELMQESDAADKAK